MKKTISYLLIAALAFTMSFAASQPAEVSASSGIGSGGKIVKNTQTGQTKEANYKEGQALVVMSDEYMGKATKSAVAKSLEGDISVKKVWDFEDVDASADKKKSAKTLSESNSGNNDDVKVALVESTSLSATEMVKKLNKDPQVKIASLNYRKKASAVTNDAYSDQQWALQNTGQNGGTEGKDTNVESAWDSGATGEDKVVAIIDTGVDYTHEDLSGSIWENPYGKKLAGEHGYDFANGDADPLDDNGHGSHCAGIIGAAYNNAAGISGINKKVKIMPLKFLDKDGSGWDDDAIASYNYINRAINLGTNVVAVNNSWGGEGDTTVYSYLMDLLGEKGAVSVCAAGNENADLNDKKNYAPCQADSDYNIVVAASNENGELAGFSNYGNKYVDVAAPGTDILSTVSYNCFNPSLYREDTSKCSSNFNDYESTSSFALPADADIKINNEAVGTDKCEVKKNTSKNFGSSGSGSLQIDVKGAKKGDFVTVSFPYKQNATSETPAVSAMVTASGPKATEYNEFFGVMIPSYVDIADVDANEKIESIDDLGEDYMYGGIDGESNYWDHLYKTSSSGKTDVPKDRKICVAVECNYDGDYSIDLDDFGLSADNAAESTFGKYDFYNGTSMAAPQVTAAVALVGSVGSTSAVYDTIDKISTSVRTENGLNGKVSSNGTLDFSKTSVEPAVRGATVDWSKKQIHIKGYRFDSSSSVKIDGKSAAVVNVSSDGKDITVKDDDWINRKVDIEVISNGSSTVKDDVYLVRGKTSYQLLNQENDLTPSLSSAVTTDGTRLIYADSSDETSGMLLAYDPSNGVKEGFSYGAEVSFDGLFKAQNNSQANIKYSFGKELVYCDGAFYNISEMRETSESMIELDIWKNKRIKENGSNYATDNEGNIYSTDYKFTKIDPDADADEGEEVISSLGDLPKEVDNIGEGTLAAYNGKIYLIGGYDYTAKKMSSLVMVYDPAAKKWSKGPALPSGRAGGKAVQTGNSLVYTLGYSDTESCRKNLVFDGNSWKESGAELEALSSDKETLGGKEMYYFTGSIGVCAGGIMYAGTTADGLGDTYSFSTASDKFTATEYNNIKSPGSGCFVGTAVGGGMYGLDQQTNMYKVPISSGLVQVKTAIKKGGSLIGSNIGILPGAKVTLTPKAKKAITKCISNMKAKL